MLNMAELSIIIMATDPFVWQQTANTLPMCVTEDSTNCVWYAEIQGNGEGIGFIALENDERIAIVFEPLETPDGITAAYRIIDK